MEQKTVLKKVSKCGKCTIFTEADMSAAAYHDFMLEQKGWAVDLMVKIQKEQEAEADILLKDAAHRQPEVEEIKPDCASNCEVV